MAVKLNDMSEVYALTQLIGSAPTQIERHRLIQELLALLDKRQKARDEAIVAAFTASDEE